MSDQKTNKRQSGGPAPERAEPIRDLASRGLDVKPTGRDVPITVEDLESQVVEALKTVYDPEIPINIYDLGLIYEIRVSDDRSVYIKMTLTAPNCPAAEMLPQQVEHAAANVPHVTDVRVQLTFDPPFTPEMMSEEARLTLGFM